MPNPAFRQSREKLLFPEELLFPAEDPFRRHVHADNKAHDASGHKRHLKLFRRCPEAMEVAIGPGFDILLLDKE